MNFKVSELGNAQFHECPSCGSSSVHQIDTDALCLDCPWDSAAWSVANGAMDDLIYWGEESIAGRDTDSDAIELERAYQIAL